MNELDMWGDKRLTFLNERISKDQTLTLGFQKLLVRESSLENS